MPFGFVFGWQAIRFVDRFISTSAVLGVVLVERALRAQSVEEF